MSCCAIGRKVVEATNACRIRRTRGDIGLFRFLAAADRVCAVPDFALAAAVDLLPVAFLAGAVVLLAGFDEEFEDGFEDFVLLDWS